MKKRVQLWSFFNTNNKFTLIEKIEAIFIFRNIYFVDKHVCDLNYDRSLRVMFESWVPNGFT